MVHTPPNSDKFNTPEETQAFGEFVGDHFDDCEALFDLIEKLFPSYNELHPERPKDINLQTFLYGFADMVLSELPNNKEVQDGA